MTLWYRAVNVTLLAALARLVVGAFTPLFPDETYYWEWSRRLAGGYFDHPPMIAWIISLGTMLGGDTPLGVRLGPNIAGTAGAFAIALTARRLAGPGAALTAALVFAVMPLASAGLILATPDAPLLAAIAGTVYCLVRAFEHAAGSRASTAWWCAAGAMLGLGLLSKYTAVLVAVGVFFALVVRRELRPRLREPGPYIATVISLVVFAPCIAWNAGHDWVSFAFQLGHGLGASRGSAIGRVFEMIGGQLGLVSPILFVMMVIAAWKSRILTGRTLAIAAAFVFVFFMYSATRRRVEANWPALAYVPGALLLAAHAGSQRWRRWLSGGLLLAGLLTAIVYVNSFTPILPVPARRDPVARSIGWDELGRAASAIHAPLLSRSSYRTWLAADRYQEASLLAFHVPDHPQTFALNLTTRPNQYDLWPRFEETAQPRDGIILVVDEVAGDHGTVEMLRPHFERVIKADSVTLARDGDPVKHLRIWRLERWLGTWPQRELR